MKIGDYQSAVGNSDFLPAYVGTLERHSSGVVRVLVRSVGRFDDGAGRCVAVPDSVLGAGLDVSASVVGGVCDVVARRSEGELSEDDRRRSVGRSIAGVRAHMRTLAATRLLTLTVRRNVADLAEFQAMAKRFHRALKKSGAAFPYVMVFERQKRGAWHAHYAVNQFLEVRLLRRLWVAICGGKAGDGNVDIRLFRTVRRLGQYLGKYITKNIDDDPSVFGKKRFWSTPNGKPEKTRFCLWAESVHELMDEMRSIINGLGLPRAEFWLSRSWKFCSVEAGWPPDVLIGA